jgi:hypothetical protein
MSARNIIGRLVSRWLKGVRQKAVDRQAWHNFLRHYPDQATLRRALDGSVQYDEFVDLVEEAYGLPVSDTLGTVLFSDFEDYADKIATTSDEAIEAGRGAAKESDMPNFKGSYLGRFPLVSADFWTSDHLSERSRSVDAFSGTRARGTLTLKRR